MAATGGGSSGAFGAADAGIGMIGALSQADAMRDQGAFAEKMSGINARRAENAANDAIRRGEDEAAKYGTKVRQMVGSQKASLAAQGIVVSSGDAAALQKETKDTGATNVETLRNNAYREAMGFKQAANEASSRGRVANATANYNANSTIAAGGMKAVQKLAESGVMDNLSFSFDGWGKDKKNEDLAINTRNKPEEAYNNLFGDSKREMVG